MIKNILIICSVLVFTSSAWAEKPDIEWKGKYRVRAFQYGGQSTVNGYLMGKGSNEVTYFDLFFRNEVFIHTGSIFTIKTKFDTFAVFGENDASIGGNDLGFQIRNIYLSADMKHTQIEIGFLPFTIPGGFILATDGGGAKIVSDIKKIPIKVYGYWLKAFDNSRYDFGNGVGVNNYVDSDIYSVGFQIYGIESKAISGFPIDIYYVYHHDKDHLNGSRNQLHWAGLHSELFSGRFFTKLDAIYNFGDITDAGKTTQIKAGLASLIFGFMLDKIHLKAFAETATGDLENPNRDDTFQNIKGSHYISNIVVDNSGGMSIHSGAGFAGLFATGMGASFSIQRLTFDFTYAHFRGLTSMNYAYGNEFDLNTVYLVRENITLNLNCGIFLPDQGYADYTAQNTGWQYPVYEVIAAVNVKY
ncbi:MAG: hypothetical protein ABUK01_13615 [Leptospirales bacterium]